MWIGALWWIGTRSLVGTSSATSVISSSALHRLNSRVAGPECSNPGNLEELLWSTFFPAHCHSSTVGSVRLPPTHLISPALCSDFPWFLFLFFHFHNLAYGVAVLLSPSSFSCPQWKGGAEQHSKAHGDCLLPVAKRRGLWSHGLEIRP